jgi:hypothetical protein
VLTQEYRAINSDLKFWDLHYLVGVKVRQELISISLDNLQIGFELWLARGINEIVVRGKEIAFINYSSPVVLTPGVAK